MPTKEMVEKYEELRSSGRFNMLSREALEWMEENASCSKEEYIEIKDVYDSARWALEIVKTVAEK